MKIRCNRNEDSGSLEEIVLPIDCSYPISNQNFVCSSNWFIDSDGKQRCCINVGTIYMVYSIIVVQGKTHYLSNSAYRGADSIFWSGEMPTLLNNPRVTEIIIHIFE